MRKHIFHLAALLLLFVSITSCGGSSETSVTTSADFEMQTISVDTVCKLFKGNDSPQCDVHYKLHIADGDDASYVNKIIVRNLFPVASDSTNIELAASEEMRAIVDDYNAILKGVTRKSISEGKFPASMAQYRRNVTTVSKKVKDDILVYTATVQEKAYGEIDSLVNQFTFNISLSERCQITLDDIFVPGYKDRLAQKIVDKLSAQYKVSGMEGLQRKGIFIEGIPYASDNIIIADNGLTFVYNPFEIAGRTYGMINVTVTAEEVKDIMDKKWQTFFELK